MNMQGTNARQLAAIEKVLSTVNAAAPAHGRLSFVETVPFGASLTIDRYQMDNGLALLLCEDKSAPVVSVHTWFRVGSRHEHEGKTGLAHLFEHLMFNEIEGRGAGFFDRTLEEAGAESNASTWLDWTQYNIAIPKEQLGLVL
jgi:zinc protease